MRIFVLASIVASLPACVITSDGDADDSSSSDASAQVCPTGATVPMLAVAASA